MTGNNGFLCFVTVAVLWYIGCVEEDIKPDDPSKRDIRLFTITFHEEDLMKQLHFVTHVDFLLACPSPEYVNTLQVCTDIVDPFNNLYVTFGEKFWQKTPLTLKSKTVILLKSISSLGKFWTLEGLPW